MKIALLFSFLMLTALPSWSHPLHFSIAQMDYSESSGSLQISVKIFSDDLLDALNKDGHKEVMEESLLDYFSNNFQVKLNEKDSPWIFIGHEVEEEVTFVYLEIKSKKPPKSIQITNTLILNLFEDQTNIVHLNIAGNKYTLTTDINEPNGSYPAN